MSVGMGDMNFLAEMNARSPAFGRRKNARMLVFGDSPNEHGGVSPLGEVGVEGLGVRTDSGRHRLVTTPPPCNARLWDSGLGSPTPGRSPKAVVHTPNIRSRLRPRLLVGGTDRSRGSPIPYAVTLDSDGEETATHPTAPDTPPHRRLRSLRLNDTPHTPKSLVEKASRRSTNSSLAHFLVLGRAEDLSASISPVSFGSPAGSLRGGARYVALDHTRPQANINPFASCRKRRRNERDRSVSEESLMQDVEEQPSSAKRLALSEINTSRYIEEFHQVSLLGDGQFGSVFECVNRLDGCTYAIKKSKMPVAGSIYERNALNEVYAHAVLGKHTHVVRYYSAWAEDNHMYIQNEYCNGGSLGDFIMKTRENGLKFSESDLAHILMHIAQGLKYIHDQGLVHLDIKPANVFIHREVIENSSSLAEISEDLPDDDDSQLIVKQKVIYKIGDLGHVTSVTSPLVEEGDCRYLPNEILQERYEDLPKADVFSLALTVFETGTLSELPKNGILWHELRDKPLPDIAVSSEFNSLLKQMAHNDPKQRPSAASLTHHPAVCPFKRKSWAQLYRELNEEKMKNKMLAQELESQKLAGGEPHRPATRSSSVQRLLGRTCNRSMSLTVF